jgi:hypothetical protein
MIRRIKSRAMARFQCFFNEFLKNWRTWNTPHLKSSGGTEKGPAVFRRAAFNRAA